MLERTKTAVRPAHAQDPLAELARLIDRDPALHDRFNADAPLDPALLNIAADFNIDAVFYPGSILCGYEHEVVLPEYRDAFSAHVPDPARDAFFHRDISSFYLP